jgi:hypothetical protein
LLLEQELILCPFRNFLVVHCLLGHYRFCINVYCLHLCYKTATGDK